MYKMQTHNISEGRMAPGGGRGAATLYCIQSIQVMLIVFCLISFISSFMVKSLACIIGDLILTAGMIIGFIGIQLAHSILFSQKRRTAGGGGGRFAEVKEKGGGQVDYGMDEITTAECRLTCAFWLGWFYILYVTICLIFSILLESPVFLADAELIRSWIDGSAFPPPPQIHYWPFFVVWIIRVVLCYLVLQGCTKIILMLRAGEYREGLGDYVVLPASYVKQQQEGEEAWRLNRWSEEREEGMRNEAQSAGGSEGGVQGGGEGRGREVTPGPLEGLVD
eukprot:GHVQ01005186.1.p1 GENE.GHVQ01005186.1~~GHVQ01005186.1.p1  ORF type:complete len:279 (-),score=38.25 GHVQ01005186.1:9-845(-)